MKYSRCFLLLSALFITSLIISNIIAIKIISFGSFFLPAGIIVFPITYIIGDVLTEIYGLRKAREVIFIGFAANLLAVIYIFVSLHLPSAPFWHSQEAFEVVLSQTAKLLTASFLGYIVGSLSNAWVMHYVKKLTNGKFLWIRTISSTIIGEGIDTLIFITIAFASLLNSDQLIQMMFTQWLFKVAYETVATPLTYFVVGYLKKIGED